MKKLLGIIILIFLFSANVYAKNTKLIKGSSYQEKIKWKHLVYKLPEGEWKFLNKTHFSVATIKLNLTSGSYQLKITTGTEVFSDVLVIRRK